jgi:predicted NBD/HSP70 family sugar kinase
MPGWNGFDVRRRFEQRFDAPTWVDNDVNLLVFSERARRDEDTLDLIFCKVGSGIGAGLLSRGRIHRGANGAAGDIGHVRVRGGPDHPCVCGNVGCIEAVASASAVARSLAAGASVPVTIADVRARLAKADPAAVAHVREAAAHIGELVAMLVHFYNPARVTIGGSLTAASDDLLAGVRSVVYQRALPLATRNLVLANSVLGEYAGLAGAAVLGIEQALSASEIGTLTA